MNFTKLNLTPAFYPSSSARARAVVASEASRPEDARERSGRAADRGQAKRGSTEQAEGAAAKRSAVTGRDVGARLLVSGVPAVGRRFTLPYPPTVNTYWRIDRRGFARLSDEARAYKRVVGQRLEGMLPCSSPVVLSVDVYRPRRIGDLDNTLKALCDSLRGFAFVDDSQVVELHARRFDDKANPRAEVTIAAVTHG